MMYGLKYPHSIIIDIRIHFVLNSAPTKKQQ